MESFILGVKGYTGQLSVVHDKPIQDMIELLSVVHICAMSCVGDGVKLADRLILVPGLGRLLQGIQFVITHHDEQWKYTVFSTFCKIFQSSINFLTKTRSSDLVESRTPIAIGGHPCV